MLLERWKLWSSGGALPHRFFPGPRVGHGKEEDNYKFRTPSLRNIGRTGPYLHDGSYKTLDDVLFYYFRGVPSSGPNGLALDIESLQGVALDDMPGLIAFLEALSGEEPKIAPPELP